MCKRCGAKFTDERGEETTARGGAWKAGDLTVCKSCHADDVARQEAAAEAARPQAERRRSRRRTSVRSRASRAAAFTETPQLTRASSTRRHGPRGHPSQPRGPFEGRTEAAVAQQRQIYDRVGGGVLAAALLYDPDRGDHLRREVRQYAQRTAYRARDTSGNQEDR